MSSEREYIRQQCDKALERVINEWEHRNDSNNGWDHKKDEHHTKVFTRKVGDSSFLACKGHFTYENVPDDILERMVEDIFMHAIDDLDLRKKVDPDCNHVEVSEVLEQGPGKHPRFVVSHSEYNSGNWLVSNRDFVILRDIRKLEDKNAYVIAGCSPDEHHPIGKQISDKIPVRHKCVRGNCIVFGWYLEHDKQNKRVNAMHINHTDPRGNIPSALYNALVHNQILAMYRYDNVLKTWK